MIIAAKRKIFREKRKIIKENRNKIVEAKPLEDNLANNIAVEDKPVLSDIPIDVPDLEKDETVKTLQSCIQDVPDNLEEEKDTTPLQTNKTTAKRWGREDDKRLFQRMREYEKQGLMVLEDLLKIKLSNHTFKHPAVKMLASELGW